jgi:ribonuclease Z
MRRIRKLYDGPLALAVDYMVFNVSKDSINIRMSAIDEEIWPSPAIREKIAPDVGELGFSPFTISGALPMLEVVQPLYDEINDLYGTDFEPFFKGEDPEE